MGFFGKSKPGKGDISDQKTTGDETARKSMGTILRQPDEATPITKEKDRGEFTALEMADRQDWEIKTLSVWQPGDVILDTYEVEDLFSGGMGHVYIANHKNWKVKLAIKSPNEVMLSERDLFARILREANSWTELGLHPNIAYCYYVRNIEEVPHIFVEYVDGGNLRQWIEEGKCIDYRTSLDLAIQFCHGMEHAHSKGMIHRDIKPENILMTQNGILKITDFGLVRGDSSVAEPSGTGEAVTKQPIGKGLTTVGMLMGTEGYMSPEQAERIQEVDERADIFSFGVCLYEMFCGNRPYDITYGPKQEPPNPVSLSGDKSFPPDVAAVLTKAVLWEPSERFKSFSEIRRTFCGIYLDEFGEESPYAELELLDLEADGLNNQGVAYYELGRKEDAVSCWQKAIEGNPLHPEATYNLSLVQWRDAVIADDEVLRRLENCKNRPAADHQRLAELESLIHAERLDFLSAKDVLKELPEEDEEQLSSENYDQIKSIHILKGHTLGIDTLAFSPDGCFAISGSGDKTVRVWELETGECINILEGHTRGVESVAISSDNRHAISGSVDKTARVWELSSGRNIQILRGHSGGSHSVGVSYVEFSSDGRHIISAARYDPFIRVWDIADGKCVYTLEGHARGINCVAVSSISSLVVTGGMDKTLRLWELNGGRSVHRFEGHRGPVSSVAISPDGKYAVSSARNDKILRLWDLTSGRCLYKMDGHLHEIKSVAISADGRYAASGSRDKSVRVWDLSNGQCSQILENHMDQINCVAISRDGRYVLSSGSRDRTVRVWDLASSRCLSTLIGPTDGKIFFTLGADNLLAVSGNLDRTIQVYRIATGIPFTADLRVSSLRGFKDRKKEYDSLKMAIDDARLLHQRGDHSKSFQILYNAWKDTRFSDNMSINTLYSSLMKIGRIKKLTFSFQKILAKGHTDEVSFVAISPNSRYAVSGSRDKTIRIWEFPKGRCVHILKGHANIVKSISLSPNGRFMISEAMDDNSMIWELVSGRCIHKLERLKGTDRSFAISSDGKFAASCNRNTVRVWDIANGNCLRILEGHTGNVDCVVLSPNGLHVVSGSVDKKLRVWELDSGRCIRTLSGHTSKIVSIVISPDGKYVISTSLDRNVRVWELSSGQCVHLLKWITSGVGSSSALSPDGLYAVSSATYDKVMKVWEVRSGNKISSIEGHTLGIKSVALSPNGRYAVTGSHDKTIRLWELESGKCINILKGHTAEINSVAISQDGRYVVSGGKDNTVRVWELIWDLEFPDPVDWDEGLRPYLEIFLTLRNGKWTGEDFQELINELAEKRGYGWVRPEGVRKELEKMSQTWKA